VTAQVVTALLLGDRDQERGSFPAVRLRGARVTGRLDLMGPAVKHALVLLARAAMGEDDRRQVK
jgi:hypothetical protein